MRTAAEILTYKPCYGITSEHWRILQDYADEKHFLLVFRDGKEAAIDYIQQKFPAKPLELKVKTDPKLGLLLATQPKDQESVFNAGYYLLRRDAQTGAWGAVNPRANPSRLPGPFSGKFPYVENLVIHPNEKLPVTSDYDLAVVVDMTQPDLFTTYGSLAPGKDATNWFVSAVATELNHLFGSTRIMHGSQAQDSGDLVTSSLAKRNRDLTQAEYDQEVDKGELSTVVAFLPISMQLEIRTSLEDSCFDLGKIVGWMDPGAGERFPQRRETTGTTYH